MAPCLNESQMAKIAKNNEEKEEEQGFSHAMQLATGAAVPMALKAVVELGVLDIVAKAGPAAHLSALEIASQLPSENPDALAALLDRLLRLLASHSVLTSSDNGGGGGGRVYGLAPVAKYFVGQGDGASLAPLLVYLQDKVLVDAWYGLGAAVLEGGTAFESAHGEEVFSYFGKNPRINEAFYRAMSSHTMVCMEKLLQCYNGFEDLNTLVDVGGAHGHALAIIISKYPHIKGISFDLPHVIDHALPYPGLEHKGGDMFESVPNADAIFMKWILHDWDDEHCLKLLKNCYEALPNDGKVIVVESVIPDDTSSTSAASKSVIQLDIFMMAVFSPGARERSETEFLALATNAGFKGIRFQCLVYNLWVMEFYK